jgi:hypothetical protein
MASRREEDTWRLIAVLQSTGALGSSLAMKLYETAVGLHLERKESASLAGDDGVGTVRAVGRELLLGVISGPGFEAQIDTAAGRCTVSYIVTREGLAHAEEEIARQREEVQRWN